MKIKLSGKRIWRATLGVFAASAVVGIAAANGCRRPERPEGLPELYPCEIVVTFGGEPLEGVLATLTPESPELKKWRAGGTTDAEGRVEVKTAFCWEGVAAGTYRLGFTKEEERVGDTAEEMTPISLIPLKYAPQNSELTFEAKPGKNKATFELDAGEELFPTPTGFMPSRPIRGR